MKFSSRFDIALNQVQQCSILVILDSEKQHLGDASVTLIKPRAYNVVIQSIPWNVFALFQIYIINRRDKFLSIGNLEFLLCILAIVRNCNFFRR